jgi:hypothetical protein
MYSDDARTTPLNLMTIRDNIACNPSKSKTLNWKFKWYNVLLIIVKLALVHVLSVGPYHTPEEAEARLKSWVTLDDSYSVTLELFLSICFAIEKQHDLSQNL